MSFSQFLFTMSLSLYKKKRRFGETPEPEGKKKATGGKLKFVVQKHDASHVHYDFRLEMEGVLKSWAIPKGPSLNPADKRLAMMVEDHPYDYRTFEGIIPAGNYGGGTVIVWDEGTFEPLNGQGLSAKEQEKMLLHELYSGNLKIILHGEKLNGEFALFQMKGRGERSWILMKKKDEFSSAKDITQNERSVKTGRTLAQVAKAFGTTLNHPDGAPKKSASKKAVQLLEKSPAKKAAASKSSSVPAKAATKKTTAKKAAAARKSAAPKKKALSEDPGEMIEAKGRKSKMPKELVPMLATLVDEPFDGESWLFEIKWDGYRAVAFAAGEKVELVSRNLVSFSERYAPVADALKELSLHAVLDGEIVAVNEKGLAVFQDLQNWQNTPVQLQYFVFDLLWLNGYDVTRLPLIERKKLLEAILPKDHATIRYSDHVICNGKKFFEAAVKKGLEGVMGKRMSSIYEPGSRTGDWVKVKVSLRQEVLILGYTQPRNTRQYFGSLLLGLYDESGELVYIGHTGSGFTAKTLKEIHEKMQPLTVPDPPFAKKPKTNMPATWLSPKLVGEIKFTEWTKDRIARHPIFMGLRTDKDPKDVTFEKAMHMVKSTGKIKSAAKKTTAKKTTAKKTPAKKSAVKGPAAGSTAKRSALKNSVAGKTAAKTAVKTSRKGKTAIEEWVKPEGDQEVKLNGHVLQLTNLNKVYWKEEGFRKGDMINYYHQVAPYMLPYLKDRPHSLNRHPNGVGSQNFFQKDVSGKAPEWITTHEDFSESTNQHIQYLVCKDEASLIYMANLGCIEINPWHSRSQKWQNPDWCLIDLDPDTTNSFDEVMEVAKVVKKVLDSIGADCYCKTSGATGIHILIPLGAKYDYDQSKQLAELTVNLVNQELPDLTSVERRPANRKGKIYLDFLQNRETQTAAAPYSLRPKPGVPVSTPLDWSELRKGLTPKTWNAGNIFDRLRSEGDIFKPVLGKGIDLLKVLRKLEALFK
jgi:bifunctional non-homologous end joining protein LigD